MILCAIPGSSLPKASSIPYIDKIVHAGLYFILSSFLIPVFGNSKNKFIRQTGFLIVLFIVGLYGGFIEIAQEKWFTNRSGDIFDLLSDLAGGILAIGFYYLFLRRLIRLHKFRKTGLFKPL